MSEELIKKKLELPPAFWTPTTIPVQMMGNHMLISLLEYYYSPLTLAYGYTFDRHTLEVRLVHEPDHTVLLERIESLIDGTVVKLETSPFWIPEYFTRDVKRWYLEKTDRRVMLWFAAFGVPLSTTPAMEWNLDK